MTSEKELQNNKLGPKHLWFSDVDLYSSITRGQI
jgi:hypothetical protein